MDSLLNIGPCGDVAMGEPAFLSEEYDNSVDPCVELVTTSGHGKNGALSILQRSIKPQVLLYLHPSPFTPQHNSCFICPSVISFAGSVSYLLFTLFLILILYLATQLLLYFSVLHLFVGSVSYLRFRLIPCSCYRIIVIALLL